MAKYSNTKAKINEKITTNTVQAITGNILNDVLQTMVDSLGADYQFGGLVQPGSSFTAGEQPVVFLATTPGTYTNFGGLVVADGEVALLVWSGTAWSKQTPDISRRTEVSQLGQQVIYDVSANNDGETFASLSALLSSENLSTLIPIVVRCGGMSIRFAQTSDNKYVQYRCIADEFTTDATWWAITDEGVYVKNSEYLDVCVDSEGKLLEGIKEDGTKHLPGDLQVDGKIINQELINKLNIIESTQEDCIKLWDTNNIIDQNKLISGYYIQYNQVHTNPNYKTSDYTFVSPQTIYLTKNLYNQVQFFDKYKVYLGNTPVADSIQTPADCYYIRVCSHINNIPKVFSFNDVDENIEIRKQIAAISIDYTWEDGYYDSALGIVRPDANYSRTTKFSVKAGDVIKSSGVFNYCFWNSGGLFIGSSNNNPVTCPDGAELCAINFRNTSYPNITREEIVVCNVTKEFREIVRWSDVKCPNAIKNAFEFKASLKNDSELSMTPIQKSGDTYLIDIDTTKKYSLHFEFKMPSIVNTDANTIELVKCNYLQNSRSVGGVDIDIVPSSPIAGATQQPKYRAMLGFYPVTVKNNNYHAEFKPDGEGSFAPWTGEDVFSIRFAGDVTDSSNHDIVYSLDENGLTVKHSGGSTILNEHVPISGSIEDFAKNMVDKCAEGGDYYGIIEFAYYNVYGNFSELIQVSDIPLVSYYSNTEQYDAFPSFITRVDTKWHSIDILFDPSCGSMFYNLMQFYVDGTKTSLIDYSLQIATERKEVLQFAIGNINVPIRNIYYVQGVCKIQCPKIIVCMMHPIVDDFVDYTGGSQNVTSLTRLYNLCEYFKEKGFKFVPFTDIVKHVTADAPIDEYVYTIIHDDFYYIREGRGDAEVTKRWRDAYKSMGMKPSFAIIPHGGTYAVDKSSFEKDSDIAEFHLHDDVYYAALNYETVISTIRNTRAQFASDYKESNIFTYPGGSFTANTKKIFKHEGFCCCTIVGGITTGTGVTKAFEKWAIPRLTVDNRIPFSQIKAVIDALSKI